MTAVGDGSNLEMHVGTDLHWRTVHVLHARDLDTVNGVKFQYSSKPFVLDTIHSICVVWWWWWWCCWPSTIKHRLPIIEVTLYPIEPLEE
jgi:hypothetical protein